MLAVDAPLLISDLDVNFSLTHTSVGSPVISLAHVGSDIAVILSDRRDSSSNDLTNATFDDEAAKSIRAGVAPFTGPYCPEGALSAFGEMSALGKWRLIL